MRWTCPDAFRVFALALRGLAYIYPALGGPAPLSRRPCAAALYIFGTISRTSRLPSANSAAPLRSAAAVPDCRPHSVEPVLGRPDYITEYRPFSAPLLPHSHLDNRSCPRLTALRPPSATIVRHSAARPRLGELRTCPGDVPKILLRFRLSDFVPAAVQLASPQGLGCSIAPRPAHCGRTR